MGTEVTVQAENKKGAIALLKEMGHAATEKKVKFLQEMAGEAVEVVPDRLHMAICIDQVGIEGGSITGQLVYEREVLQYPGQPLDLAKIAGGLANQVAWGIRAIKEKSKGFNVSFKVDNQLVANVRAKDAGRITFRNPIDMAHKLLQFIAIQFDQANAEGLLLGNNVNSAEIAALNRRFGVPANKPLILAVKDYDAKRKATKKAYAEMN